MSEYRTDGLIEKVAHELKRSVFVDPSLDIRVMEEVRALGRPSALKRFKAWWLRPRDLALSPATGVAAVAVLALMVALAPVRWGDSSPPQVGLVEENGGQLIQFRFVAPEASSVSLAGDFNDWNEKATPLRRIDGDIWQATLRLSPGRYEYTFVIDGERWEPDPWAPPAPTGDFDVPSSIVMVPEA